MLDVIIKSLIIHALHSETFLVAFKAIRHIQHYKTELEKNRRQLEANSTGR